MVCAVIIADPKAVFDRAQEGVGLELHSEHLVIVDGNGDTPEPFPDIPTSPPANPVSEVVISNWVHVLPLAVLTFASSTRNLAAHVDTTSPAATGDVSETGIRGGGGEQDSGYDGGDQLVLPHAVRGVGGGGEQDSGCDADNQLVL